MQEFNTHTQALSIYSNSTQVGDLTRTKSLDEEKQGDKKKEEEDCKCKCKCKIDYALCVVSVKYYLI